MKNTIKIGTKTPNQLIPPRITLIPNNIIVNNIPRLIMIVLKFSFLFFFFAKT